MYIANSKVTEGYMSTIQFKEVDCKNCYKCLRSCPVKAISFSNDHARIIEEECILCGRCLNVCPQNAKTVKNDVDKVKEFLEKKYKVYASIAPSFAPAFNIKDERHIYRIFKKLGFTFEEETAIGAQKVTMEYQKLLQQNTMPNIITTACSTIVSLIEKYYPELIDQMAPVVSPVIAHAKMMKELYGSKIKVVFICPCLSKKEEYKDFQNDDVIDAVITFEEFESWLKEEGISVDDLDNDDEDDTDTRHNLITRCYPAPGGILQSLGSYKKSNYKFLKFDGIGRCMEILDQIKENHISGYFIEMNSCIGGCLGGPCMNSGNHGFLQMRDSLIKYISKSATRNSVCMKYDTKVDFRRKFIDKSKPYKIPDDSVISGILAKIGKFSKEDELNCGSCGYATCREKAIAVYNGKAELHMCLPYMRERAESISNVIINSTPNAIFALTDDLNIHEVNSTAIKLFNLDSCDYHNKNIYDILDCPDILNVIETKHNIYNSKFCYSKYNIIVEQSILYIKENHMTVIIIRDITKYEKKQQAMHDMQRETIEVAQNVIDKQMRVAQEIASLLGETTAETKVALTKLKNSILTEIGED